nr:single-stranded-DNA-specific exonuclease RecJ [Lachnospiraceae bacterium]
MTREKWVVTTKKADFNKLAERFHISPMLARIIRNRDVISEQEINVYLNGTLEDMHAPKLMHGMEQGASLLLSGIAQGKHIRVIGDYDADGVCASYILKKGMEQLGGRVSVAIPHRVTDGYGVNLHLIEEAHRDGVDIIVTCDNGIAAAKEIASAKQKGMTVIVTDHHEVPYEEVGGARREILPPADVIINPKQQACTYPYKGICGALVAYKLVQMLFMQDGKAADALLKELLEFAAIATVCDVMELLDENRIVVKYGLKYMMESSNLGLRTLIDVCGLSDAKLGSYHLGFVIGPCLNATGRLDTAMKALLLFDSQDTREAYALANELKEMNESRKSMTEKGVEDAIRQVEDCGYENDKVLVVYLKDCHESIAGIIAGRLKEKYYKPVFVLTDGEEGLKGSGRSIEGYSMYDGLHGVEELLDKYGGHKMAAGLSLQRDNLEAFRLRINGQSELTEEDFVQKIRIDIPLPLPYASMQFAEELTMLEPFGNGNHKPLFAQKNLKVHNCTLRGKNKNVAGFVLEDETGYRVNGIYFGEAELFVSQAAENGNRINITYYPDINEFRGNRSLQIVATHYSFEL